MNDDYENCITCGTPAFRPEGHAEWCEDIAEVNRLHNLPYQTTAVLARGNRCINGHAYTSENTYIDPKGRRACRACARASENRNRPKRMAARRAKA